MSGWSDERLFMAVQKEKRFLITGDKGFGDLRRYPPRLLHQHRLEEFQGCLVIVTPHGIRVRRPE